MRMGVKCVWLIYSMSPSLGDFLIEEVRNILMINLALGGIWGYHLTNVQIV